MKHNNLTTVVTDNQLTADTIAKAIGANEKHDGYYLGNGFAVTWTNGRVVEANYLPDERFVLSTTMDCRLVYAHNFKFVMRNYDKLVGYNKSEQDAKQLLTIKTLWKMSGVIVNAMIPDAHGDLDFLNLYYFIALPKEVRRAWLPMLTKRAILHGVMHGPSDRKAYETWLAETIYNHLIQVAQENLPLEGAPIVEEITIDEATRIAENIGVEPPKDGDYGVSDKYVAIFTDQFPLYNVNALLVEAAVELDFSHEKTIQTAYALYAKKLISYPLTMQNTIPGAVWNMMRRNKEILRYNSKWGKYVSKGKPSHRHNFRMGESIYNGYGIVTTGLHPIDLNHDEETLYNLIVRRVIKAFTPMVAEVKASRKKSRSHKKSMEKRTRQTS